MGIKTCALFRWMLLALVAVGLPARAATIQIDIDTSILGLNGQTWDLAFDFIDGDGVPLSNTATISSFVITGGSLTGAPGYPIISGDVTGNLSTSPPVILKDTAFSEYLDNAMLGSLLSFVLEITENTLAGLTPDAFSLFILDPATGLPIPTPDPTGALLVYSIGNDDQPTLFCPPDIACATVTPVVVDVPEPGALALGVAALLAMGIGRRTRRGPSSRG